MLSADLVIVQRRKDQLILPDLNGKAGESVLRWAEQIVDTANSCIGLPRQELSALVQVMGETQQARKLTKGLAKLIEDASEFEQGDPEQAVELRRRLFLCATDARCRATTDRIWNRNDVVQRVCQENGWDVSTLDERMYADLPGAQRLLRVPKWTPQQLFEHYDRARVQAVLLRAVQVRIRYARTSTVALRELFRQMKFRQLLHQSQREGEAGLRLTIDGPMTLFESATKYGLQLALLLPALRAAGPFELEADVRWGKTRGALQFTYKSKRSSEPAPELSGAEEPIPSTDEVRLLLTELEGLPGPFVAQIATTLIDLPGVGICVPDITFFERDRPERRVHFELLGYWSRSAVWQRVELVESGLTEPIVFGVNKRLRVSEEVLSRDAPAALYVFRGHVSASALLTRVAALASRQWP